MSEETNRTVTTLTDTLLLQRLAVGDEASFDALFYRHYDRVYGLLFRLVGNRAEAEDLTQEVFIKLYNESVGPRPFFQRPRARDADHNVGAWLYRVATNLGYNALRGRRRRWERNLLLVPDPAGTPGADQEVERRERETAVRAALLQLPERDGQLLLLRQLGLSYTELAAACDVAPGSVGTLLRRAGEAFRQAYASTSGDAQT